MKQKRNMRRGFTLLEMLVVGAIITVLAGLLLPSLASGRSKALEIRCASNHRQLALVWTLYAGDHDERLVRNGYVDKDGEAMRPLWVQGYYNHANSPRDSTNLALMTSPRYSLFAPYVTSGDVSIYHCPADRGCVAIDGALYPRYRSCGMNWNLGFDGVDRGSGRPTYIFQKTTALSQPTATLVTVDVSSNSICWPFFGILPTMQAFHMLPGRYHRNGSVLSFADGHTESKRWIDSRTFKPPLDEFWHGHYYRSAANSDLMWLQLRSGQP